MQNCKYRCKVGSSMHTSENWINLHSSKVFKVMCANTNSALLFAIFAY